MVILAAAALVHGSAAHARLCLSFDKVQAGSVLFLAKFSLYQLSILLFIEPSEFQIFLSSEFSRFPIFNLPNFHGVQFLRFRICNLSNSQGFDV